MMGAKKRYAERRRAEIQKCLIGLAVGLILLVAGTAWAGETPICADTKGELCMCSRVGEFYNPKTRTCDSVDWKWGTGTMQLIPTPQPKTLEQQCAELDRKKNCKAKIEKMIKTAREEIKTGTFFIGAMHMIPDLSEICKDFTINVEVTE